MSCCFALFRAERNGDSPLKRSDGDGQSLLAVRYRLLREALACTSKEPLLEALSCLTKGDDSPKSISSREVAGNNRSTLQSHQRTWANVLTAMKDLKKAEGKFGLDIGGTLVKCALISTDESKHEVPEYFGVSAQRHSELDFDSSIDGQAVRIHFVSSETAHLDSLLMSAKTLSDAIEENRREHLQVVAAGGGAHRFKDLMRRSLNVDVIPFQEFESLVSGLRFLCSYGPDDEVFGMGDEGEHMPMLWPWPLFPCLLVIMGSGVSILRIEADRGNSRKARGGFTRVGGTACGGASFLGLVQLLTSATSFREALALAERGDPSLVNKLVSDIYGKEGCATLGLPGEMTAAYFGKLVSMDTAEAQKVSEADLAAAVLTMVVQSTVTLAAALSTQSEPKKPTSGLGVNGMSAGSMGTLGLRRIVSSDTHPARALMNHRVPVFFAGGFLARNPMAQKLIGKSFRRLTGSSALFLKHSDFLGALGAVGSTI